MGERGRETGKRSERASGRRHAERRAAENPPERHGHRERREVLGRPKDRLPAGDEKLRDPGGQARLLLRQVSRQGDRGGADVLQQGGREALARYLGEDEGSGGVLGQDPQGQGAQRPRRYRRSLLHEEVRISPLHASPYLPRGGSALTSLPLLSSDDIEKLLGWRHRTDF